MYAVCNMHLKIIGKMTRKLTHKYTNPANGILDFCLSKSSGPSYSAKETPSKHCPNHRGSLLGGPHEALVLCTCVRTTYHKINNDES